MPLPNGNMINLSFITWLLRHQVACVRPPRRAAQRRTNYRVITWKIHCQQKIHTEVRDQIIVQHDKNSSSNHSNNADYDGGNDDDFN